MAPPYPIRTTSGTEQAADLIMHSGRLRANRLNSKLIPLHSAGETIKCNYNWHENACLSLHVHTQELWLCIRCFHLQVKIKLYVLQDIKLLQVWSKDVNDFNCLTICHLRGQKFSQSLSQLCNVNVWILFNWHTRAITNQWSCSHWFCEKNLAEDDLWLREGMLFPSFQSATEKELLHVLLLKNYITI